MNSAANLMDRQLPHFEPRLPEFLMNKMTPVEREIFKALDINSQQTEHTLRVVLEGREERHKLIATVDSLRSELTAHVGQDKKDFEAVATKQTELCDSVSRCAATLESWTTRVNAVVKTLLFFFGRKGLLTGALIAMVTWYAVEWAKSHPLKPQPTPPAAK